MSSQFSKLSLQKKKVVLILFCIAWGGVSLFIIVNAISQSSSRSINIEMFKVPAHIQDEMDFQPEGRVDKETILQIKLYKKYMDSTKQAISPALLDSMDLLEQLYLSQ